MAGESDEKCVAKTGEVLVQLDKHGYGHATSEDLGFEDKLYSVVMGLRIQRGGAVHYGRLDIYKPGDFLSAQTLNNGRIYMEVQVQARRNKEVGIVYTGTLGTYVGPTRSPKPGPTSAVLDPSDPRLAGLPLNTLSGISELFKQRLNEYRPEMKLIDLAKADVEDIASTLDISEVRALGFIVEAQEYCFDALAK